MRGAAVLGAAVLGAAMRGEVMADGGWPPRAVDLATRQ
jgi:hypothetical protein